MAKQTQSLAAQSGALTQELKLPALFSAPAEPLKAMAWPPYIAFAHHKRSDEWKKILAKYGQPEEGEMFLNIDGGVVKLDPAKLAWVAHRQYWAQSNAAGTELIASSFVEMPRPYKEHVEAVVLVYLPERIIVANVCFRSTKCSACKPLCDALEDAKKPEWAELSPAHKETLVCQQPWMRFFGDVRLSDQKTSKTSGLPYRTLQCDIQPTSVPEWRLLKAFQEHEGTQKAMDKAAERFVQRIAEVKAKLPK